MNDMKWGLLGPETLVSLRRTRTLGVASVVRHYNELAVPGMGGIWFARQLYLALLGISAAEKSRQAGLVVTNIETANAIEALGCWMALKSNGWQRDSRVRGATKLYGVEDVSFLKLRKRSAYVTQPMRMSTVQPLIELGFVTSSSERFNAYKCTDLADEFIDVATKEFRPFRRSVLDNLLVWMKGGDCAQSRENKLALSPMDPMATDARDILRNQIVAYGEGSARRKAVLEWVNTISHAENRTFSWNERPIQISEGHWRDLMTGGLFFQLRDAAVHLLDLVEARLGQSSNTSEISIESFSDDLISAWTSQVRRLALEFLDEEYDASPDRSASRFCLECCQDDNAAVIRALIDRDGHVLRRIGDNIKPGPAFRGEPVIEKEQNSEASEESDQSAFGWPEGISGRVKSLFFLNADLNGELDKWLGTAAEVLEADDES